MENICVDCDIFENVPYDFCFYAVNQSIINKDNLPISEPGEMLMLRGTNPYIAVKMKDLPYKKKGILVYNSDIKWEQEK